MRDLTEAREAAEKRALALRGAAEIIAAHDDIGRLKALLALSGMTRLVRAIEQVKPVTVQHVEMLKGSPDPVLWSSAADRMIDDI